MNERIRQEIQAKPGRMREQRCSGDSYSIQEDERWSVVKQQV